MWHYVLKRVINMYTEIFEVDGKQGVSSCSTNFIVINRSLSFVYTFISVDSL